MYHKRAWLEDIMIASEARDAARIREEEYSVNVMQRFMLRRQHAQSHVRQSRRDHHHKRRVSLIKRRKIRIAHAATRRISPNAIPPVPQNQSLKRPFFEIHAGKKKEGNVECL